MIADILAGDIFQANSPAGAVFSAGGGITALSDPAGQYHETLVKATRGIDLGRGAP